MGKQEGKRQLRRPRRRWMHNVRMDLQEVDVGMWMDWAGPGKIYVAGSCECGNEHSGSLKCAEYFMYLQTSYIPKMYSAPWSK